MNLSQEAQALRDYLAIRGLNDGEIERAMGRVVDMALERAAKVASDELVHIFEDTPDETDDVCNAVVRNIMKEIRAMKSNHD